MEIVEYEGAHHAVVNTEQTNIEANGVILAHENMELLRQEREKHRHRTIWTKDAHGGPYRKVGNRVNTDIDSRLTCFSGRTHFGMSRCISQMWYCRPT